MIPSEKDWTIDYTLAKIDPAFSGKLEINGYIGYSITDGTRMQDNIVGDSTCP